MESDNGPLKLLPLQLWSVLKVKCLFETNGCKLTFGLDKNKMQLQPLIPQIDDFCTFHNESKIDALFIMLN